MRLVVWERFTRLEDIPSMIKVNMSYSKRDEEWRRRISPNALVRNYEELSAANRGPTGYCGISCLYGGGRIIQRGQKSQGNDACSGGKRASLDSPTTGT